MKWKGRRGSENVDDRRSQGGKSFSSGSIKGFSLKGGIGLLVVAGVIWLMGGNPLQVLEMIGGVGQSNTSNYSQTYTPTAEEDEMAEFVSVVLADTEEVWEAAFKQMGRTYRKPTLVLFTGYTTSACGSAQSSTGPFYCSLDEKVYIDLSFFQQMENQLRAGGDFAYAYVIAHEVGHHVQKLLGTLDQAHQQMANTSQKNANKISVALELQADFYAGYWAHHTERMFGSLEADDIEEALNAANAIGDDRLQEQAQGHSVPDSFTHGTSKQRHDWFYKGYRTGDLSQGNSFAGY
ncbi:putative metalloprotease [Parabacteroides sp. PFB2-12]|uniref:KPN_02809 family neutral zinc metallopeptidase n=1 Tax=unclassified Parabacteroides TaxID=2649774 RepID=UPI002476F96B|nr:MULTISPECIES: neutral zinc metallopeptidase [unclassified Parabacteroides]MDH6342507.1 putative metalloprotease [Parabacteroides sp. PM6-13]MDH6390159.1 putative metalloprotease [Parabacteroides sp. PFB2-12]